MNEKTVRVSNNFVAKNIGKQPTAKELRRNNVSKGEAAAQKHKDLAESKQIRDTKLVHAKIAKTSCAKLEKETRIDEGKYSH